MSRTQSYFFLITKGIVTAEFVMDNNGSPSFYEKNGYKNYRLIYRVNSERKNEIKKVIYRLHSSYYDPIRETKNKENDFELKTSTYGEYPLTVEVYLENEMARDIFSVVKLLKQTYESYNDQAIEKAIKEISKN